MVGHLKEVVLSIEVINLKENLKALDKIKEDKEKNTREAIAVVMTHTRYMAGEDPILIADRTGETRTSKQRKKQPSVPGKLTSRTGKLKFMLQYKATGKFALTGDEILSKWKGSKVLFKENTIALKGLIRTMYMKEGTEYLGTYKVQVEPHHTLFRRYGGMPLETMRTLRMRFNWETGIRGSKRPVFKPAAEGALTKLKRSMEARANIYWRV